MVTVLAFVLERRDARLLELRREVFALVLSRERSPESLRSASLLEALTILERRLLFVEAVMVLVLLIRLQSGVNDRLGL